MPARSPSDRRSRIFRSRRKVLGDRVNRIPLVWSEQLVGSGEEVALLAEDVLAEHVDQVLQRGVAVEKQVEIDQRRPRPLGVSAVHGVGQAREKAQDDLVVGGQRCDLGR